VAYKEFFHHFMRLISKTAYNQGRLIFYISLPYRKV